MEFDYLRHLASGRDKHAILEELMTAYGRDVWNYAYFLTRSRTIAEDVAQDVFVKAFQGMGSFRGETAVKSWLLTITRNTSVDYLRSAWVRRVSLLPITKRRESHPSAETEWFGSQEQNRIWAVVLELPRKLREVLLLHVHHRLSLKEISQLLGLNEGTVKSRLHRARQAVSRDIQDHSLSEGGTEQ